MIAAPIPFDVLFDAEFLASIERLRLTVHRVAGGGRAGERLSRDLGAGLEFRDYRPYVPGDDLRAIDWNIYRRLGKLFLRLYEEQQDLPLYLMPDVSASMFLEPVPRAVAAFRCALALAAIGVSHHDSAGLFPFADEMQVRVKAMSGRTATMAFAEHLARLTPPSDRAGTSLSAALRRLATMKLRAGLLVIVSDFFDAGGLAGVRAALAPLRHRLLLVQLVRRSDAAPDLTGDVRLKDCESGEIAEITATPRVLARYRQAYERFTREIAEIARHHHGGLLRLDVDADVVGQLHTLFAGGSLRL